MKHISKFLFVLFTVATLLSMAPLCDAVESPVSENTYTNELRYRELFFNYYRKDFFTALSRLEMEHRLGRLPKQDADIDLLKGSLYFSYGMPQEAETILLRLTKTSQKQRQKDLAWFYLARMYFRQGSSTQTDDALKRITEELPKSLVSEFRYLVVMQAIAKGQLGVADNLVDDMDEENDWAYYARFNLGAALIKSGQRTKGERHIDYVGKLHSEIDEYLSLRDKANLTLGYYNLKQNRAEDAINYFERVRADGPYTNKALLGMGWAFAQDKIFDRALAPWVRLSQGSIYDVTVQESLLASSFAYSRAAAEKKALESYRSAISRYEQLQKSINDSIHDVQRGRITGAILTGNEFDDFAITNRLRGIVYRENGSLIVSMLQDDQFQKLLRTYRDLRYLHLQIDNWKKALRQMETSLPVNVRDPGKVDFASRRNESSVIDRVNRQKIRVELTEKKLNETLDEFEKKLQDTMVERLEQEYQYVTTYLSQAKLAVAQLFDAANKDVQR